LKIFSKIMNFEKEKGESYDVYDFYDATSDKPRSRVESGFLRGYVIYENNLSNLLYFGGALVYNVVSELSDKTFERRRLLWKIF